MTAKAKKLNPEISNKSNAIVVHPGTNIPPVRKRTIRKIEKVKLRMMPMNPIIAKNLRGNIEYPIKLLTNNDANFLNV